MHHRRERQKTQHIASQQYEEEINIFVSNPFWVYFTTYLVETSSTYNMVETILPLLFSRQNYLSYILCLRFLFIFNFHSLRLRLFCCNEMIGKMPKYEDLKNKKIKNCNCLTTPPSHILRK